LVRVTRIDHPEAMLIAPDQAYFLRENLKLRLLNARLSLLSRQITTAHNDLAMAEREMTQYFESTSRQGRTAQSLMKQVQSQLQQTSLPRLDGSLAALATAAAGR
jgi:uroporphyrin-3 C-methyltransferase